MDRLRLINSFTTGDLVGRILPQRLRVFWARDRKSAAAMMPATRGNQPRRVRLRRLLETMEVTFTQPMEPNHGDIDGC